MVSTNGNTGILVAGDSGKEAEQLTLSRIKIYGDKIKVSIGGYGSFVAESLDPLRRKSWFWIRLRSMGNRFWSRRMAEVLSEVLPVLWISRIPC